MRGLKCGWRPSFFVGDGTNPLSPHVDAAIDALRAAAPLLQTVPMRIGPLTYAARFPAVAELTEALAQRLAAMRPNRPALPIARERTSAPAAVTR